MLKRKFAMRGARCMCTRENGALKFIEGRIVIAENRLPLFGTMLPEVFEK